MPKYVIERQLPGAGALTEDELTAIACRSNEVLQGMGGRAQWIQSFVLDDAIVCLYVADGPEAVREHGDLGGFPVTGIRRVHRTIDPTTADRPAEVVR